MKKLSMMELDRPDVEQFKKSDKNQIIVVLDNVRSALNVGSFFRTCDGFAVETLYLTGITACPPNREIQKTAIGATESVSWEYRENIVDAVTEIKAAGYKVWGVEQTNQSVMLDRIEMSDQKIALVFGNEVDGLSEEITADVGWLYRNSTVWNQTLTQCCGVWWYCPLGNDQKEVINSSYADY
jgi:23S rRNA (guanosine2251-2'-O)-methyltransferase